jgi:hypothetical protein
MGVDRLIDQELAQLSGEVEKLTRAMSAMERRVEALEGMLAIAAQGSAASAASTANVSPVISSGVSADLGALPAAAKPDDEAAGMRVQTFVALVGRTLLVLGGAYFLSALTEAHVLPPLAGVAAGPCAAIG